MNLHRLNMNFLNFLLVILKKFLFTLSLALYTGNQYKLYQNKETIYEEYDRAKNMSYISIRHPPMEILIIMQYFYITLFDWLAFFNSQAICHNKDEHIFKAAKLLPCWNQAFGM